jgi:glycogen synthase
MTDSPGDSGTKPLRVLMTADAVGGVWQYSIDLVTGLAHRGVHALLATMGPRPSEEQRRQARAIPNLALAESEFALEWMPDPWRDVDAAAEWLLDLQANFGADVIHLNGYAHAALNWHKPVIVVAHSCVYSWWRAVHGIAAGTEWSEYGRRVNAGLLTADAIVAPSAAMAMAIEREYSIAAAKIRVIHNFTGASPMDFSPKEPFVLAAGRIWDQAKNITLLSSIAPQLDWEIRVAGTARPELSQLQPGAVRFLGELTHPEMLQEMARAAIFAHPALYEPFGLSVLEAARAGCCLVLSDIQSLRELWDGAALFINPRDPRRWASELNALASDSVRRQSLGEAALSHANNYCGSASIDKYCDLYASLLELSCKAEKEAAA